MDWRMDKLINWRIHQWINQLLLLIIIINEKNLTWRLVPRNCKDTEHTLKDDVFSTVQYSTSRRQKLRHQYDVANKYIFKCRLNVDSDGDDVTNDGRLFHVRAAATGKARSPMVLRRVTGTTTAAGELERRLRLCVLCVCVCVCCVCASVWLMALNGLSCADVPLKNYSLTHSLTNSITVCLYLSVCLSVCLCLSVCVCVSVCSLWRRSFMTIVQPSSILLLACVSMALALCLSVSWIRPTGILSLMSPVLNTLRSPLRLIVQPTASLSLLV